MADGTLIDNKASQQILWIPFPNGFGPPGVFGDFALHPDEDKNHHRYRLRLSVAVRPRIEGYTLPPDWLDWPQTLREKITFTVNFCTLEGALTGTYKENDRTQRVTLSRVHAPRAEPWSWLFNRPVLRGLTNAGLTVQPWSLITRRPPKKTNKPGDHPVEEGLFFSYPVGAYEREIAELYGRMAATPGAMMPDCKAYFDSIRDSALKFRDARQHDEYNYVLEARRKQRAAEHLDDELKKAGKPAAAATRPAITPQDNGDKPPEFTNAFDFHRMVSTIGEYPALGRMLGLIVDLEISGLTHHQITSIGRFGHVIVNIDSADQRLRNDSVSLKTLFGLDPTHNRFYTAAEDEPLPTSAPPFDDESYTKERGLQEIRGGFLNLRAENASKEPLYALVQSDVEGAVEKLLSLANTVCFQTQPPTPVPATQPAVTQPAATTIPAAGGASPKAPTTQPSTTPSAPVTQPCTTQAATSGKDSTTEPVCRQLAQELKDLAIHLPVLRSAGISLVRAHRAKWLELLLRRFAAFEKPLEDAANKAKGSVNGSNPCLEGVTITADVATRGYRVDIQDVGTGVWRSLCARSGDYHFFAGNRVHRGIVDEGFASAGIVTQAAINDVAGTSSTNVPVLHEALFRWDGWSLAVERPSKKKPEDDEEDRPNVGKFPLKVNFQVPSGSLPRLRFGSDYRLRVRCVDIAGNSPALEDTDVEHAMDVGPYLRQEAVPPPTLLKRRSNLSTGETLERLVVRSDSFLDATSYAARAKPGFYDTTDRHVVPPKTSVVSCERHGMFDQLSPADAYNLICTLEGNLPEGGVDSDSIDLPYLCDPAAHGAIVEAIYSPESGTTCGRAIFLDCIPFDRRDWPRWQPFRIRLEGGTKSVTDRPPTRWDASRRVYHVWVPRGQALRLRISSLIPPRYLEVMRLFRAAADVHAGHNPVAAGYKKSGPAYSVPKPERHTPHDANSRSANDLINPGREIVLVHALPHPLESPVLSLDVEMGTSPLVPTPAMRRQANGTLQLLSGQAGFDPVTTGNMEVLARWTDYVDGDKLDFEDREQLLHVDFDCDCKNELEFVQNLGKPCVRKYPFRAEHALSSTKHLRVNYALRAAARYADHFRPEDLTAAEMLGKNLGKPFAAMFILNTARPAPPEIDVVVPSFGWKSSADPKAAKIVSTRSGFALRVYLKRPWFSSGQGEMLGVVLQQDKLANKSPTRPYVTQWAADPLCAAADQGPAAVRGVPALGDLVETNFLPPELPASESGKAAKLNVPLSEPPTRPDAATAANSARKSSTQGSQATTTPTTNCTTQPTVGNVDIVAFPVVMSDLAHEDGPLCYADIEFKSMPAYFPFVRLALVRYQPWSICPMHISPVTIVDFAQLASDRTATITRGNLRDDGRRPLTITIEGPMPADGGPDDRTLRYEAQLEVQTGTAGRPNWARLGDGNIVKEFTRQGAKVVLKVLFIPGSSATCEFRVVIREYEFFKQLQDVQKMPTRNYRLVYCDAIPITVSLC